MFLNVKQFDRKSIVERIRAREPQRKPIQLYLNAEVFKRFREIAEKDGVSASRVIEELMKEYAEQKKP